MKRQWVALLIFAFLLVLGGIFEIVRSGWTLLAIGLWGLGLVFIVLAKRRSRAGAGQPQ